MKLKIIFVNPNTEKEIDKYVPQLLAEAIMNKIEREGKGRNILGECDVKPLV